MKNNIDIKKNILLYYNKSNNDPNHRYNSWEHCYSHFKNKRFINDNNDLEITTLHLAFYLASWGMYRPSSKLLQKDYRVHTSIVQEIINPMYHSLWNMNFEHQNVNNIKITLIFDLIEKLRELYDEQNISPTNTLISKVLLGTLGCIPAYDRFFKSGIREWGKIKDEKNQKFPAYFGKNSYIGLINFYNNNKVSIDEVKKEIDIKEIKYPIMRLIDMYFWNLGNRSQT